MAQSRIAVLAPGRWGGDATPWMLYSAAAAMRRGSERRPVVWNVPDELAIPQTAPAVRKQVSAALDDVTTYESVVLIGKSLGTFSTPLAAERGLPAIWHTPLLRIDDEPVEDVIAGLRAATAPCLLIGGTADPAWDGDVARSLTPHVLELDGADHGYFIEDAPLAKSIEVLGEVVTAVEQFLDTVIWPTHRDQTAAKPIASFSSRRPSTRSP